MKTNQGKEPEMKSHGKTPESTQVYLDNKPVKVSALLADNPGNSELAEAVSEILSGTTCVKIGGGAAAEFIVSSRVMKRGESQVISSKYTEEARQ